MDVQVAKPDNQDRAAHQLVWQAQSMGMAPMSWPAPNGQPIVAISYKNGGAQTFENMTAQTVQTASAK